MHMAAERTRSAPPSPPSFAVCPSVFLATTAAAATGEPAQREKPALYWQD